MTITKTLFHSKFSEILMDKTKPIINKWSTSISEKIRSNPMNYPAFGSDGTTEEKYVYSIAEKFWSIQDTLENLDKVFYFIEIDRSKIIENYPKLESQKNYYQYHIENYIIRIYSLIDLLGKIGNILYKTNIPSDKCNGYNFKEEIKKTHPQIALQVEDILNFANEYKKRRHNLLHNGQIQLNELNDIAFWEDYLELIPEDFDIYNPVIKAVTNDKLHNSIKKLRKHLTTLIEKINMFLDSSIDNL